MIFSLNFFECCDFSLASFSATLLSSGIDPATLHHV